MKKAVLLMAFVLLAALLVSCARKGGDQLVGNWQKQNGSDTIVFSKDGKAQMVNGPATITTTYKLSDKGIELDLGILGTSTLKYSLSKDELTLADPQGKEVKYLRVKEAKAAEHSK